MVFLRSKNSLGLTRISGDKIGAIIQQAFTFTIPIAYMSASGPIFFGENLICENFMKKPLAVTTVRQEIEKLLKAS